MAKYVYKKRYLRGLARTFDIFSGCFRSPDTAGGNVPGPINKILVMRLDHIGDIVMSTVVLRPLRSKFPDAEITFMVPSWGEQIVSGNREIDRVEVFDPVWFDRSRRTGIRAGLRCIAALKRRIAEGGYDAVIDLRGDLRHIMAMYLAGVPERMGYGITGGGAFLSRYVRYPDGAHETMRNIALLAPFGITVKEPRVDLSALDAGNGDSYPWYDRRFAVIHAVPGDPDKGMDNEVMTRTIRFLSKSGIAPVMVGSSADSEKISRISEGLPGGGIIDLSGKTDLRGLYSVLRKAVLFVGVDSAPAHMAAAADIPAIVLFGPLNDPEHWEPIGRNVRVINWKIRDKAAAVEREAGEILGKG